MEKPLPELPKQWIKGLVPTMNDTGFMFEVLDHFAEDFIEYSGSIDEIGRAHVWTPVTDVSRMPSSAWKKKKTKKQKKKKKKNKKDITQESRQS